MVIFPSPMFSVFSSNMFSGLVHMSLHILCARLMFPSCFVFRPILLFPNFRTSSSIPFLLFTDLAICILIYSPKMSESRTPYISLTYLVSCFPRIRIALSCFLVSFVLRLSASLDPGLIPVWTFDSASAVLLRTLSLAHSCTSDSVRHPSDGRVVDSYMPDSDYSSLSLRYVSDSDRKPERNSILILPRHSQYVRTI